MNLIDNPSFSENGRGWSLSPTAAAALQFVDDKALVTIANPTLLQFYQKGIAVEPSMVYRLTFNASSSNGNPLAVHLLRHTAPYNNYGLSQTIPLEKGVMTPVIIEFQTPEADSLAPARFRFWFTAGKAGDVYTLHNPVLELAVEPTPPISEWSYQSHVIARRWEPGDVIDVRLVHVDNIVTAPGGDIDWDKTPNQRTTIAVRGPWGNETAAD